MLARASRLAMVFVLGVVAACGAVGDGITDFDGDCEALGGPAAIVGLDWQTGELVWERTVGGADGVALAAGVVAGTGQSGAAWGVGAETGELLWCKDFGQVNHEGNIVLPGFAASDGVVATALPEGDVVGIEPSSGRELWRTTFSATEGLRVEAGLESFRVLDASAMGTSLGSLNAATGAERNASPALESTGDFLDAYSPYLEGRQEVDVVVVRDGQELWSDRLPGFMAELLGDLVMVIDQTGGTGAAGGSADTRVAAYEVATGELRWEIPLPGTPHLVAAAAELVLVPSATEVFAIDSTSGDIAWTTDTGSPGQGGRFSTPGAYSLLKYDETSGTVVGLVVAQQPYTD